MQTTTALGFVLFASIFVLSIPYTGQSAVAPPDKDVRVITGNNVPVPVAVQGTATGNINNSPTVQIGNNAANPVIVRDADRPTAQPYQKSVDINLTSGEISKYGAIPVPNGKIFVIEQISGFGNGVPDERVDFSILVNTPDDSAAQFTYLLTTKEEISGNVFYRLNQQVRLYSSDVPFPLIRVDRFPAKSAVNFKFTVSGYLVNK